MDLNIILKLHKIQINGTLKDRLILNRVTFTQRHYAFVEVICAGFAPVIDK